MEITVTLSQKEARAASHMASEYNVSHNTTISAAEFIEMFIREQLKGFIRSIARDEARGIVRSFEDASAATKEAVKEVLRQAGHNLP